MERKDFFVVVTLIVLLTVVALGVGGFVGYEAGRLDPTYCPPSVVTEDRPNFVLYTPDGVFETKEQIGAYLSGWMRYDKATDGMPLVIVDDTSVSILNMRGGEVDQNVLLTVR